MQKYKNVPMRSPAGRFASESVVETGADGLFFSFAGKRRDESENVMAGNARKQRSRREKHHREAFMITVNLYYTGTGGAAARFAAEMETSGIADAIRAEEGNLRYQYFQPLGDPETILLIDSWANQAAIDAHHASPMMKQLAALREKYDLHMRAERYVSEAFGEDEKYIRK